MPKREGSEFVVKLDGIKLPSDVESQIAREIQATVLREIARIDLKGDLVARFPRKEWLGIWLRIQKPDREVIFNVSEGKQPG